MNPFLENPQIEEFMIEERDEEIPEMDDLMSDLPFDTSYDF